MGVQDSIQEGTVQLEQVIASKNPGLLRWIPGFVLRYLKRVVHIDQINQTLRETRGMQGVEFSHSVLASMGVRYECEGLERVPQDGRYLFVSNHPLGGLDGMVLIALMGERFEKLYFPVNDLLTRLPQMNDIFLPINKHGAQKGSNVASLLAAYSSDAQVLYFPAGLCSRKIKGRIQDLEWKSNFIAKAVEYQRDVVPIYFEGRNSNFFYNLANLRRFLGIRANVEMLYLVDEMYKQEGASLKAHVGTPIAWETFLDRTRGRNEWALWVREQAYSLARG